MTYYFHSALRELKTARSIEQGKPIANNTRLLEHRYEGGEITAVAIRHFGTDILIFFKDGSMEINPYDSRSTKARLWEYANVSIYNRKLPTYNRRLPIPNQVLGVSIRTDDRVVPFQSGIRVDPNGKFDLDSIDPETVELILDDRPKRALIKKMEPVRKQIAIRERLGVMPDLYRISGISWITANLDKPLEEIDFEINSRDFAYGLQWHADEAVVKRPYSFKVIPTAITL